MSGKALTEGFRSVIELRWSEFILFESDMNGSNFDGAIAALVRACRKGNLRAIQTALDRLDGKVAMEIEVEYPKFYTLYPNATKTADDPSIIEIDGGRLAEVEPIPDNPHELMLVDGPHDKDVVQDPEEELPTGSLRKVLEKMIHSSKKVTTAILESADSLESGDVPLMDPHVKSVIVAGLMKLVHDGRMGAVFEVFDQLDGKVADKYKILGGDVHFKNYATIAPAGAVRNEDGIYQVYSDKITNSWVARLEQTRGKR
jgi:hypothetical protein